jgi:serine/threonine protein kinase
MEYEPGKLPKKDDGDFTYYGEKEFVDRIIAAWKAKEQQNKSSSMHGVYGTVYKLSNNVNVEKKQYYVKQIIPKRGDYAFNISQILNEVELSNILTAKFPDSVSNLKGAKIMNRARIEGAIKKYNEESLIDPNFEPAYLIYEGHEGKTLQDEFNNIRSLNNTIESIKERLNKYLDLICSARKAIDTLNSAGYSHNDIHLENIFVINDDEKKKKCILIDFGSTRAKYKKVTNYSRDIRNLILETMRCIFTEKRQKNTSDHNNELVPFETYDFKVFFSI